MQSILHPHGPAATEIAGLAWVLFAGGGFVLLLVVAAALVALRRETPGWLRTERFVVAAGIAFPIAALSALLLYVYLVGERLHAAPTAALKIEVVGEQWWWRVRYADFETANEIRIPVGQPVELVLRSADVLHSFWVPSLAGKVDMIPGRDNRLLISAATEGLYRGQCAEFCGGAHALMALHVLAQSADQFESWRELQRRPAAAAPELFRARCGACHAVRGTQAAGTRGPDLTHVASRAFIAAGTLPNTPGNMAAWLADSQHAKPGNLMPAMRLNPAELESLTQYMASLK
jgi:cytochrome c oxidase subunit II